MEKLKLKLDELKIESFIISDNTKNNGTVAGNEIKTINHHCNQSVYNICPQTQICFKTIVDPECFVVSKVNCQSLAVICNTINCNSEHQLCDINLK